MTVNSDQDTDFDLANGSPNGTGSARVAGPPVQTGGDIATLAIATSLVAFLFGIVAMALAATNQGSGASTVAQEANATLELTDFKISPKEVTVEAGDVSVLLVNKGPSDHNLRIEGVALSKRLKAGQTQRLKLGKLEEGKYTWFCTISGHREAGMSGTLTVGAPGTVATATGELSAQAVDEAHEKVVQAFLSGPPAKTAGIGGQPITPKMEDGVKVFELTAKIVQWEVSPGKTMEAWTYNGTVPGPELRVKQGERFKVRLKNELPQSTSIHWHGVEQADYKQRPTRRRVRYSKHWTSCGVEKVDSLCMSPPVSPLSSAQVLLYRV